jgi:hypothetical protein
MNKAIAQELDQYVETVAERFSQTNREGNFNNESFELHEIIPMTDVTATVVFKKNTGKQAAFFFYYIAKGRSKGWKYFVPTDAHILGMHAFNHYKLEVERNNYKHNFNHADTEA